MFAAAGGRSKRPLFAAICLLAASTLSLLPAAGQASAQQAGGASAEQRRAAGEAYRRGSAAYLAENWAQAARWFETAHGLAPAAPALVQAIRAHRRAGSQIRAATLAVRLEALYPDDQEAARTAREVLAEAGQSYVRVDVVCAGCTVSLDETLLEHPSFYVDADTEHRVSGHFDTGDQTETVRAGAGERVELRLEAPAREAGITDGGGETTGGGGDTGPAPPGPAPAREGISSTIFWIAASLTVAVSGVTLWSGLDTLAGVDDYEAAAASGDLRDARDRLESGQDQELRTNLLIGATVAFAAATVVFALLTDWEGDPETEDPPVSAALAPLGGGGGLALLRGRLP